MVPTSLLALVPTPHLANVQATSSTIPTADPRPLMYVVATVFGCLALWVAYTLLRAETRAPRHAAEGAKGELGAAKTKGGDDVPK
jgi:hypothetical protein